MNKRKAISLTIMLILLAVACVPWGYSMVLSVKEYYAGANFYNCPWIGFANYQDFFTDDNFLHLLKNELIIGASAIVTGALYVFLSVGAIVSIKNTKLKAISGFVLLLVGAIPEMMYTIMYGETVFPMTAGTYENMTWLVRIVIGILGGLRFSSLFVVAGLFTRKNALSAALRYSLLFVAAGLMSTLAINLNLVLSDMMRVDTFRAYAYNLHRIDGNYGYSAMVEMSYLVLTILPAAVGTVIAALLYKKEDKLQNKRSMAPMSAVAVIPAAIAVFAIVVSVSGQWFVNGAIVKAILIGMGNALFSAAAITGVALLVVKMVGELKTSGIVLVCIWCLLAGNMLGKRMFLLNIGIYDNMLSIVCNSLAFIPVVVLLLAMLNKESEGRLSEIIPAAIVSGGMVFARYWCNFQEEYMYVVSSEKISISRVIRSWYFSIEEYNVSEVMYVLFPIIIVGICVAVGMYIKRKISE